MKAPYFVNYFSCKDCNQLKLAKHLFYRNETSREIDFPSIIYADISRNKSKITKRKMKEK